MTDKPRSSQASGRRESRQTLVLATPTEKAVLVSRKQAAPSSGRVKSFTEACRPESRVERSDPHEPAGASISSGTMRIRDSISAMEEDESKRISAVQSYYGLDNQQAKKVDVYIRSTFMASAAPSLPDRPKNDYVPRQDNIIEYLMHDDGLGPWWRAGKLTRPLIRELQPKAYMALANWLRTNELPPELKIPTKSETVDAQLADLGSIREAQRLARAAQRRALKP